MGRFKMIATRQSTLASGGFDAHGKTTRKAAFVARMDKLMPWDALLALIEPHYPKAGNGRLWWSNLNRHNDRLFQT